MRGACLCGAVVLEVAGAHEAPSACHCTACRRWSGAAFWGFAVAPEALTVTGAVTSWRSSPFAERAWCPACGTHLWFHDDGGPFELVPGLFPDMDGEALDREVYADRAPAYARLAGDHARITKAEYEASHPHVEDAP